MLRKNSKFYFEKKKLKLEITVVVSNKTTAQAPIPSTKCVDS